MGESNGVSLDALSVSPNEPRFIITERLIHWSSALCFIVLLFTGSLLYFPSLAPLIGNRALIVELLPGIETATMVPGGFSRVFQPSSVECAPTCQLRQTGCNFLARLWLLYHDDRFFGPSPDGDSPSWFIFADDISEMTFPR